MERVLARREVDRAVLNQYVLDETEEFEVLGPGRWPLHRMKRDFTWHARDGMHVRSPVRFDGVKVDEAARREYEADWIKRGQERQERKAKNAKAVDFGARLRDAEWHRGAGGGIFLIAPLVRLNLDVAHGFSGGPRVNIGTGFSL